VGQVPLPVLRYGPTTGTTRSVVPGTKVAVGTVSEALRQELLEDGSRMTQWSRLGSPGTEIPTRPRLGGSRPAGRGGGYNPLKRERVLEWQEPHPRTHEKVAWENIRRSFSRGLAFYLARR